MRVVKSSGFKILDEALRDEAIARWRLVRHKGGFPATGNISVNFGLRSDGGSG